jgi:Glycosyl hydrolase family 12
VLWAGGIAVGAIVSGAGASVTSLCDYQVAPVSGGQYTVQNDKWSPADECATIDGNADFSVANSAIASQHAPGAFPSIFDGCHWGDCTRGGLAAKPLQLAGIVDGEVTSNWSTVAPGGSANSYDAAYDIWINRTPTASSAPDGTEIMVWLNHHGQVRPAGSVVASDLAIDGRRYDVWYTPGSGAADCVSFEMISPHTGVTGLDIGTLISYAVRHRYASPSWYLISVEAGFEIWQGGAGLATRNFSVSLKSAARGGPTPYRRHPQAPYDPRRS